MVDQDFAADSPIGRALRSKPDAWLPAAAREKLEAWADAEDTAKAASEAAARRLRELTEQRATLAGEAERVRQAVAGGYLTQRDDTTGRTIDDGSGRLADAERALATLDGDLAQARRRYGRAGPIVTPLQRVREWLRSARPSDYRAAEPVEPPLQPGEDFRDAISRLRGELAQLRADAHRVRSAPLPKAVAKESIKRTVETMGDRGRPYCDGLLEGHSIDWPDARRPEDVMAATRDLLAWLLPGALVEALEREVDAVAGDDAEALTVDEKHETLQRIDALILQTERSEEASIEASEANGVPIARRFDADPRALLGLEAVRG